MNNEEYKRKKLEYSYQLHKARKFFKKARAVVVNDNAELLVIEVTYLNGIADDLARNENRKSYDKHYLLPGGGIDEGETVKQAVVRETLEEYGVNVKAEKYLGRNYYNVPMNIDGTAFVSNRVEYFYLCKLVDGQESKQFGIEGEFQEVKNKVYKKVKLTLADIEKLDASDLNDMDEKTFAMLKNYLKTFKK